MVGGGLGRTHDQPPVLNPLGADQAVGQFLHLFGLATKYDDLEAAFVIHVGMQRGDDHVMMLMLEVREFFGQETSVMVVDESDGAHHKCVGSHHSRSDQAVANEVAESFGTVLITFLCNEVVEAAKQFSIDGYTDTA